MRGQLREEGRAGRPRRRLYVHRPPSHRQAGGQAGSLLEQYLGTIYVLFRSCRLDFLQFENPYPGFFMKTNLDQGF